MVHRERDTQGHSSWNKDDSEGHIHREGDTPGHSSWNKDDDAEGHNHPIKDDTKDDDTEGHNSKW